MSRSILLRSAILQTLLVGALSVALAIALGSRFFTHWGWLVGPARLARLRPRDRRDPRASRARARCSARCSPASRASPRSLPASTARRRRRDRAVRALVRLDVRPAARRVAAPVGA